MFNNKIRVNQILNKNELQIFILFFFVFNAALILLTYSDPVGDFGNYYYGSQFFLDGIPPIKFYQDIHFFNAEIRKFQSGVFFENYTPVPPFSLLFYLPFVLFKIFQAKLIFSFIGLFALSFSMYRFIQRANIFNIRFYLIPLVFFQALYSNFHQGQTYLLIAALLIEFAIAYQSDTAWRAGLIIALLFCLKIFPAFVVVVIFFKKKWKQLFFTLFFIASFQLITCFVIGLDAFEHYYSDILPRLLKGDVTQPFGFFNQSIHTFLLNTFVFSSFLNPLPLIDSVITALLIQSTVYALVFSILIDAIIKRSFLIAYFFGVLSMLLLSSYSTVYGLLALIPFVLINKEFPLKTMLAFTLVLMFAVNIPIYKLAHQTILFQYARLWLLLLLFIALAFAAKIKFQWNYFLLFFLFFFVSSLPILDFNREHRLNLGGNEILYNFDVQGKQIRLFCNRGYKDTIKTIEYDVTSLDSLSIQNNGKEAKLGNQTLYTSEGKIKKCLLINHKDLLALTDEHNGVGLYRLILKRLK